VKRLPAALAAAIVVLAPGRPAWAHNELVSAEPAAGAVLAAAPRTVTLRFLGELNPDFTTVVVSDPARQRVPAAGPVIHGGTATLTLSRTPPNGVCTVAYRTVSVDGHVVQGSYTFTLAGPAAAGLPAHRSGGRRWLAGVGAGIILAGAYATALAVRRRVSGAAGRPSGRPGRDSRRPRE
jgi:methionine-rich copper-binding protein CopC